MGCDGQRQIIGLDATTVIHHSDQPDSTLFKGDIDPRRRCIERILQQFLDRAGGPFDHLARSDAVHH